MRWASLATFSAWAAVSLLHVGSVVAEEAAGPTRFNDIAVPPLTELSPDTWDEEVRKSRWLLVKHFSPYCGHCKRYAPKYQTAYEFYYTSKPAIEDGESENQNFTQYYDFRFGTLNCIAHGDACRDHQISLYPTVILYKDGEVFKTVTGDHSMTVLSNLIEEALEKQKPGSRPKDLLLPEAGQTTSPKAEAKKPEGKEEKEEKEKGTSTNNDGKDSPAARAKAHAGPATANTKTAAAKTGAPAAASRKAKDEAHKTTAKSYNKNGISVPLTAETFPQLVTKSEDPWFIKFYAPWCPHCQVLAPTWEQFAKTMRGKLNVGEVNCEEEKKLCKDSEAHAYPTLLFFKGDKRSEYTGLRGLGDFIQYAENALDVSDGVPDVDAESFKALEAKEDVIFVYFYDHATTSEDFAALEKLPFGLVGHGKIVKTSDRAMFERFKITTWPRLMVSREGRPTYYPPLTPNAMRDKNQVFDWMRSVWLPLVPEMTVTNSRQIMDRKIAVLAVLDPADADSFQSGIRELKSAANEWMDRQILEFQLERKKLRDAKQMRIEEAQDRGDFRALRNAKNIRIDMDMSARKEVTFAWIDGVAWQRWIRTTYGIDAQDGEKIIICDHDRRKYWDNTVTGNYILVSRTSILETLDKVVNTPHLLAAKLTVSYIEKIFLDFGRAFTEHIFLTLACFALLAYAGSSWFRGRSRSRRGHARLDSRNVRDFKPTEMYGGMNGPKAD